MTWATASELVTMFPVIEDETTEKVELVIDSVEGYIKAQLDEHGIDYTDPQEPLATNLKTVTIWVAGRALEAGGSMLGITQWSQTAGPITQSQSNNDGVGNLYLTSAERSMLGISGQGRATQLFYGSDILGGGDA